MPRQEFDSHFDQLCKQRDIIDELNLRAFASSVASQIKARRKEKGLGQAELANLVDTTQSRISQMEDSSYGKLTFSTFLKVAEALDCDVEIKLQPRNVAQGLDLQIHQHTEPSAEENTVICTTEMTEPTGNNVQSMMSKNLKAA